MIRVKVKEKKSLFKNKRDNYKGKFRRRELIKYLRNELRNCTSHGIPYIVNTDIHWTERLFWVISFFICFVIIILLLSSQLSRLIHKPIVMSVEKNYFDWNMSYPAITICPEQKINNESLSALSQKSGIKEEDYRPVFNIINLNNIDHVYWIHDSNVVKTMNPRDISKVATTVFKEFYDGYLTKSSDWPVSIDVAMTEIGLCHVLNSNVAVYDNPLNWNNRSIPYKRSSIQLSVHDVDFFIQIMNYAKSFQIFIHSPDEIILSSSPFSTFNTEGHHSFGVKIWSSRISERLRHTPITFRNCRFIDEPISERYPVYSYNHCLLECRIGMINRLCGCTPHFYRPLDYERTCSLDELKCVADFMKSITTLTISDDLTLNGSNKKLDSLPRSPHDCKCPTACESDVYLKDQEEFVASGSINRVRVLLSSFPKVRVVRDMIISTYDIVLRSGGVINLCIGTSVASLVELIIIFFKSLKLVK